MQNKFLKRLGVVLIGCACLVVPYFIGLHFGVNLWYGDIVGEHDWFTVYRGGLLTVFAAVIGLCIVFGSVSVVYWVITGKWLMDIWTKEDEL